MNFLITQSWDSSVSIETRLQAGQLSFNFQMGK